MKKSDIQLGRRYTALVSGKIAIVRADALNDDGSYAVTNLDTGRKLKFKTAARFRRPCLTPSNELAAVKAPSVPRKAVQGELVLDTAEPTQTAVADASGAVTVGRKVTKPSTSLATLRKRAKTSEVATTGGGLPSHVIIVARAGTGKTTTGIGGLTVMKGGKFEHEPSDQQRAIFEAFVESKTARSIAMVAFNKSIATELSRRVPEGVDAMTMHSMGFKAVLRAIKLAKGRDTINGWNVRNITAELIGKPDKAIDPVLMAGVDSLVGLCKTNLIGSYDAETETYNVSTDDLDRLTSRYDISLNGHRAQAYDLVPRVLARCASVGDGGTIDFNDMIWLPIVRNLPVWQYDLLFVDEAQDLNPCQQELAIRAGRRLIFCGDDKQAIYGFTGADSESLDTLYDRLSCTTRGCRRLPLTVTRRCGHAIVAEAQKYVPDFQAHESNGPGKIDRDILLGISTEGPSDYAFKNNAGQMECDVRPGDMILCRTNAPLVSQCFRFLKAGVKAQIQGRDIGKQLITLINKIKAKSVIELIQGVEAWAAKETETENAKKNPSEGRLIAITDKADCVIVFAEGAETVDEIKERVNAVFSDDAGKGILLSSIHKAKGLEADRVYFINHAKAPCPHPMAKQPWAREQEYNLLYVGITRAIKELIWVG